MTSHRNLQIEGLANARDLGGLERRDGTKTPQGVFFRTEMLDRVTDDGWRGLRELGITTVIDLRRPNERTSCVPAGVKVYAVDLDGDERGFWEPYEGDGRWGTPLYYQPHLDGLPHRMRDALDAIADAPEGGILFHCGGGWDRTGFVAAMLLRAVGVTTESAAADYAYSFANAVDFEALHQHAAHAGHRRTVLAEYGHTPESAFSAFYDDLDLNEWFAAADVAPATRTAVVTWRGAMPMGDAG